MFIIIDDPEKGTIYDESSWLKTERWVVIWNDENPSLFYAGGGKWTTNESEAVISTSYKECRRVLRSLGWVPEAMEQGCPHRMTILRPQTLVLVWSEVSRSLYYAGFKVWTTDKSKAMTVERGPSSKALLLGVRKETGYSFHRLVQA